MGDGQNQKKIVSVTLGSFCRVQFSNKFGFNCLLFDHYSNDSVNVFSRAWSFWLNFAKLASELALKSPQLLQDHVIVNTTGILLFYCNLFYNRRT